MQFDDVVFKLKDTPPFYQTILSILLPINDALLIGFTNSSLFSLLAIGFDSNDRAQATG
jgi:hypothetical protein